jgi:hypothetical protein
MQYHHQSVRVWMQYLSFCLFSFYAVITPANTVTLGADIELKSEYPDSYTVQASDSVLDVLNVFLNKPWQSQSFKTMPDIFPNDHISIILHGGEAALQIKRQRRVKLSPNAVALRTDRPISTIPISNIRQFLTRPEVVEADTLSSAPYILVNANDKILMAGGDLLYARNLDDDTVGQHFIIVREGESYDDGEGSILAYSAIYLGEARLERGGDPATLRVIEAKQDIRPGDRLLPLPERVFETDFYPSAPLQMEPAQIVGVVNGVSQIGQYQVVVINQGYADGLVRGNMLSVFRGGDIIRDPIANEEILLPSLEAGTLLLFKVFEKISFALVMKAKRTIYVGDSVDVH